MKAHSLKNELERAYAWHFAAGISHSILVHFRSVLAAIAVFIIERRKAQAATQLHARLIRMSDSDLAKLGITRAQISRFIQERL